MFRAGNFKKAEERYLQAMRVAPDLAVPRVRLARSRWFVANTRTPPTGCERPKPLNPAGSRMHPISRRFTASRPNSPALVARLESHLQANPDDRDAWLVLGAEWFLSGRTNKAADVFKRLNDPNRKPDVALAAFLDASNQAAQQPGKPPSSTIRFDSSDAPQSYQWPLGSNSADFRPSIVDATCPSMERYYAAACQTDLPCPRDRDEIAARVGHLLGMVDRAVVGYEPFFDVKLVVFPEFAHAAPIYETAEELSDRLAVPIPNEHTDRYIKKARERCGLSSRPGRFSRSIPGGPGPSSTRPA